VFGFTNAQADRSQGGVGRDAREQLAQQRAAYKGPSVEQAQSSLDAAFENGSLAQVAKIVAENRDKFAAKAMAEFDAKKLTARYASEQKQAIIAKNS
jgi:hypothetical protein